MQFNPKSHALIESSIINSGADFWRDISGYWVGKIMEKIFDLPETCLNLLIAINPPT